MLAADFKLKVTVSISTVESGPNLYLQYRMRLSKALLHDFIFLFGNGLRKILRKILA